MQPRLKPNAVVNWPIPGQFIGQLRPAMVVVNSPPFRGLLITCRPQSANDNLSTPSKSITWCPSLHRHALPHFAEPLGAAKQSRCLRPPLNPTMPKGGANGLAG